MFDCLCVDFYYPDVLGEHHEERGQRQPVGGEGGGQGGQQVQGVPHPASMEQPG